MPDTVLLDVFDTGDSIFSGIWRSRGIRVWEKIAGRGKKEVRDDTSPGRINENELETADEQASEADRRGGSVPEQQDAQNISKRI
jgi:hypothetical protein